ncbi:HAD family hydrolase [Bradyrhizobium sp. AUGA SZCCT0160]|uniref:HAD family hydrolase n=1 Tax=Bradyrhizobium sp. AUGA SZCCT0160 TaxID=2807662 RepID=UPI001BAE46C4|nr:HAD family hydrolase [Bradyrhizobium sp. AUGA SZCCT0160]MBR1192871.1 HAD family hydrolase [Bradyrhizobium sp. AUGA SZCCT0160]
MPIRAIFFDVGETLIDETRLLHGWADTMGVDRAEFLAVLDDIIAKGENYRLVFERLRPGFDVRAAVAERKRSGTDFRIEAGDLYADARPCLSELTHDGWFVDIAGNQPPTAKAALDSFGLEARLITTSAELGVDKPSLDFYSKTLAMTDLDPAEVLYVGDRLDNDVIPARNFGMKTALLERGPWGRNHVRWPDAALADFILKDLAGLPALLREMKRQS